MEKTGLTVEIDNEQLSALAYFLQKKENTTPQKALEKLLQEMYEKNVPPDTREYLASKLKQPAAKPKTKRSSKLPAQKEEVNNGFNRDQPIAGREMVQNTNGEAEN